jgi:hypothetical protein
LSKRVDLKLNKKNLLLILLFTIIIFIPFFVRPSFIGADPYYYLNHICFQDDVFERPLVQSFVFDVLPCDFFVIKIVMLLFVFLGFVFLALIIEHFFVEKGFFGVCLVYGLSPILFYFIFKLENDLIAFPLLVLSILFYFKSVSKPTLLKFLTYSTISLTLLTISGIIRPLNFYFLYIGSVGNPLYLISLIIGLIFEPRSWLGLIPNFEIAEMVPLRAGIVILLLIIAWLKPLHKKEMLIATILILLQGRFMIFLPLVYAPSLINSLEYLKNKIKEKKLQIPIYLFIGMYAVFGIIGYGFLTLNYYPSQDTLDIVEQSVNISNDKNIVLYNDWELGYFIRHQNYDTNYYGSIPHPDYNNLKPPYLAITKQKLSCNTIQEKKPYYIYYCEQKN